MKQSRLETDNMRWKNELGYGPKHEEETQKLQTNKYVSQNNVTKHECHNLLPN